MQIKAIAIEHYFHVVLFVILKAIDQYFPVML